MDQNTQKINTKNEPLVSILMLTYNRARFIKNALDSVLSQTYQNLQLNIIDDGSTDGTHLIIDSHTDPRINYIRHKENAGLHPRRKESLNYATGKYTAVIDSDDVWLDPNKLKLQVSEMENDPELVLIGTQTKLLNEDGVVTSDYHYETTNKKIRSKILIRNQFTHSGVLMRTEALQKTTGYTPILAEDLELFLQLGQFGKFANLDVFATGHRVHPNSENDHGIKMSSAVHQIIKKHKEQYPNYFRALAISYLRLIRHTLKSN